MKGYSKTTVQPNQTGQPAISRSLLLVCCLLLLVNLLAGCGHPTSTATTRATTTIPGPTPSPFPTLTALPIVPAVAKTGVDRQATATSGASSTTTWTATATLSPSPTPSHTATPTVTPSPSATFTPLASATWTVEPGPPAPTITPTETITPTPTPTLTPTPLYTPTPMPTPTYTGDWVHVLLIGLDSTRNLARMNTDVIIVAAVNKDTRQVSLLSIPRDLWVYIPTYGWSRINIAHKYGHRTGYPGGGPGLLMDTIEMNFGIPIDHWVRVDFQGFARVVDALGGVEMTVACPVNLRYKPPTSEAEEEMVLEPGVYHMDGATALRYVRTRRGGSDFDRGRRQHQFLKAVWNQTKGADLLPKIKALWSALQGSYETDLNLLDVISLAPAALDLEPQRIRSRYINNNYTKDWQNADGWRVLLPRYDKIQHLVASLYAPPSATEDQVAREDVRLQVRNGTYRGQLAKIAADQLRWYGFHVLDTGLADRPDYQQTQIIVFNEKPNAVALLVQVLHVAPENIIQQPDPSQEADIQVVLGNDYDPCR